jgi:hypothetical protein
MLQRKIELRKELIKNCKALGLAELDRVKAWQHGTFSQCFYNGLIDNVNFFRVKVERIKNELTSV